MFFDIKVSLILVLVEVILIVIFGVLVVVVLGLVGVNFVKLFLIK